MKVALAQINPTVGDIDGNIKKILEFSTKAKTSGADLVVFPELSIIGYPARDLLFKESLIAANLNGLNYLAKNISGIAALVGYADVNKEQGRPLYNSCAFIEGGKVKGVQHKTLLPTYDVFDEDRYFEPASTYTPFSFNGQLLGVSICEDMWNLKDFFPHSRYRIDPIEKIAQLKPNVLINISASPFDLYKQNLRHDLARNHALKLGIPVVYVNQVGGNDELIFDGRSVVFNAKGNLIARAKAFSEDLLVVDLEKEIGEIRTIEEDPTINIYQALILGIHDYVTKCGFKKIVIGLSGGIDSALTCVLAVRAIGPENVLGVAMPSDYSSKSSVEDARQLAENLGIEFKIIPIQKQMKCYGELLEQDFKNPQSSIAQQNIQARIRGNILMALSNTYGYLVLSTGNKSELAVGYCTLYGDMCGGLAAISDLPKMMVYDVAKYINENAGYDLIPLSTIEKAPSAELRPDQKDQDDLPPYVVLDGIIHAYVEQHKSIEEIIRLGYKPDVIRKVVGLIDRNEYKRHQVPPGLKVTPQAFGLGWRMPIAQRYQE